MRVMDSNKFLGISMLVSACFVAGALLWNARTGRYQFQPSNPPGVLWVIDTVTGRITTGTAMSR